MLFKIIFFLRDSATDADAHRHERTLILPLWAPSKNQVGPTNLEIDEVTTDASLSTDMLPIIERITQLNPRINPEKYEYSCQVGDLNLGRTQPRSVHIFDRALKKYTHQ